MSSDTFVCAPIVHATPVLEQQVRQAVDAGADLIELRVDCIHDIPAVERLLQTPHAPQFILTVRSADEGGQWDGTDADRIALIERLGLLKPGFVDVELATWRRSANLQQKVMLVCGDARSNAEARDKNRLIVSHHDFSGTPGDLGAVFDALAATPANVIKAVFAPTDALDACRVLAELRRWSARRDVIALAMGEAGLLTRVLARKFGAFLTFAATERGAESAPGQPTASELRDLYRWREIGPQTPVYGVIGWPVAHSRSPHVHNAAMAHDGVDGVFVPLPVRPETEAFSAFMNYVMDNDWLGFAGFAVTLPHKANALRWLHERRQEATALGHRCGAVNTLVRTADGGWIGDNTDAKGVIAALGAVDATASRSLRGLRALVLGAGGVSRAVTAALLADGAEVTLSNRTASRAEALAEEMGCDWTPWERRMQVEAEVLANGTSVGMWPNVEASPMPAEALREGMVVFDTVYTPAETALLRSARARGCVVLSGVELFIGQAAEQYRAWHGREAPISVMRSRLS